MFTQAGFPISAQFYTDKSGMDLISPNKNDLPKISRYGAYTIYHMTYIYMYIFYTLISDHSNHKSPPPLFFFFCLNFHRWYFLPPGLVLSIVWFFSTLPPHTHKKGGGHGQQTGLSKGDVFSVGSAWWLLAEITGFLSVYLFILQDDLKICASYRLRVRIQK